MTWHASIEMARERTQEYLRAAAKQHLATRAIATRPPRTHALPLWRRLRERRMPGTPTRGGDA
jgi:hypothetical protein